MDYADFETRFRRLICGINVEICEIIVEMEGAVG